MEKTPTRGLWRRREFLVAGGGLIVGAALGCSGERKPGKPGAPAASGSGPAPEPPSWEGTEKVMDLTESLHLADLDHHGQFIDFGTAARFKYTLGGWMSGFDNDTAMNGISFTWATSSPSRIYFTMAEPAALNIQLRVKRGGCESFSVYMNDRPLARIKLTRDGWEEHETTCPVENTIAGENLLKLVYETAERKMGGKPASFAVDYIWLSPDAGGTPSRTGANPPRLDGLRQRYKAGELERDALLLPSPLTLSYYVDVPQGARLCYAAAPVADVNDARKVPKATVKAVCTPVDTGQPVELVSRTYAGQGWSEEMLDLSPVAGKLARIDLVTGGDPGSRVALSEPAIRMARTSVEPLARKAKNVIILLIDTQRADHLTVYGKTRVRSPVIDKVARESTLFERCQSSSNWTKPACATVLTGLYPDTHKARSESARLPSSVRLGSELFAAAGFSTAAFIANGYLAAEFGFNRGWKKYVNFIRENKPTEAKKVFGDALAWIDGARSGPFFTYIQTIDPHVPYDPPEDYLRIYDPLPYEGPVRPRSTGTLLEDFKRKRVELAPRDRERLHALYEGEVTYHDREFGVFLDGLKRMGVLEDTTIIVCADHGEEFFDHDSVGHGHTLHQELLHVPLIIRAPGIVPAGARIPRDVGLADVLPTALSAAGVAAPDGLEGIDLLPMARGALPDPTEAAFSSFFSEADDRNISWAVRKGAWKMRMHGPARTFLYNLADDAREATDVDEKYPLAARALRIALGQFIGAPQKGSWAAGALAQEIVSRPEAQGEKTEVPEDLKVQLRALGYMQ
jgi:choline-sulfatase